MYPMTPNVFGENSVFTLTVCVQLGDFWTQNDDVGRKESILLIAILD